MKFKIEPQWKETKEAIWNNRFASLSDIPTVKSPVVYRDISVFKRWTMSSAVASLILLVGLTSFAYLYHENVYCPAGSQKTAILPDGSKVEMNADSQIKYKPYWWKLKRGVELYGEAFFQVKKGSRFTVSTPLVEVKVLGTSFDVFARGKDFQVSCYTGKVQVKYARQVKLLLPDMQISASAGKVRSEGICVGPGMPDWKRGVFCFEEAPLKSVLAEIERRYAVTVEAPESLNYLYTGSFEMPKTADEAVEILAQTYQIPLRILK